MKRYALLSFLIGATLYSGTLTPAWIELGDQGQVLARIVVETAADCPSITIDGVSQSMQLRGPVPDGLRPVCEAILSHRAQAASVNGTALALPHNAPRRVIVIGDTGCRIKGARVQDCNDPSKWPLQQVSNRAALERPDLVVHVGDYLYREDQCPQDLTHLCGTSPAGDRWEAWAADFFTPAAKLLAAAPWAFSRGNHEDCGRAWKGWFYYLDPRPFQPGECEAYSAPYVVKLGGFELLMLDSSAVKENVVDPGQVARFAAQLNSVRVKNAWLVDHHPFWGMKTNSNGKPPEPLTVTLADAYEQAQPKGITLAVSGHVHLFELLSFGGAFPPQLVAGDAGTDLAVELPPTITGAAMRGTAVIASASRHEFGYTILTKSGTGWNLALKAPKDGTLATCAIEAQKTACH